MDSSATRGRSQLAEIGELPHAVLILGRAASGKSTLGAKLAERLGYKCLDIGAHIRKSEPLPPGSDLDSFAMKAVETVLAEEGKVLLVGFPKRWRGLEFLFGKATIGVALVLQVDDEGVLKERAAARHACGERPEDTKDLFQHRLDTFSEVTGPVLDKLKEMGLVRVIDASRSQEEVCAEAEAVLICAEALASLGQAGGSRQRRDADEADFEVSVCLLSGEERLKPLVPARAKVGVLREVLIADGETEHDLTFLWNGQILEDTASIRTLNGFQPGSIINMSRAKKPPPPPKQDECSRCAGPHPRHDCVCFTTDSMACILSEGVEVLRAFPDLRVGDMLNTGQGGNNPYRRIQRVWAHQVEGEISTYKLSQGCRLTPGHPVYQNGKWITSEAFCNGKATLEKAVYQLEIEGHIDTALVDGHVCALLGRYCGPDFGWNVFTRKTVLCDQQPCIKCSKAVLHWLSFDPRKLSEDLMPPARFEPY